MTPLRIVRRQLSRCGPVWSTALVLGTRDREFESLYLDHHGSSDKAQRRLTPRTDEDFIWIVGIRGRCAGLKNQITPFDSETIHHPYEIVLANYEIAGVEQYDN